VQPGSNRDIYSCTDCGNGYVRSARHANANALCSVGVDAALKRRNIRFFQVLSSEVGGKMVPVYVRGCLGHASGPIPGEGGVRRNVPVCQCGTPARNVVERVTNNSSES
jgi:hypothetical protein